MIGQHITHDHVLEKPGGGGMGVVCRARDAKPERDVALKFLPDRTFASGQEKARFVQEAKAASALNHPNVCTIHDISEHDGHLFIVTEHVDGTTLGERMGAMTFRQAIEIGIQVADGLAAAHEKGIADRDIKSEKIMVRSAGGAFGSIRTRPDLDARSVIGGIHDITLDGKNVLAIVGSSRQATPPITMVVNRDRELKKGSGQEAAHGR